MRWESPCRICKSWRVQGYHFVPVDSGGPTGTWNLQSRKEECIPSDNLEYLEWCEEHKELLREWRLWQNFRRGL